MQKQTAQPILSAPRSQAVQLAQAAKKSTAVIGCASTAVKNAALQELAAVLDSRRRDIIAANARDVEAAQQQGMARALQDRLLFDNRRITQAIAGVTRIADIDDPVGAVDEMRAMPSGITVGKMRVPIGTILMIYESRPNVTIDAAALALKSGNAIILRGGSEAQHTNAAIAECIVKILKKHRLAKAVQVVNDTSRALVGELLQNDADIDLVIPRGGKALIERVAKESRIAVLKHLDGNCHVYVDSDADVEMARTIVENSKTRHYGVCNAAESLLIHTDIAARVLPPLIKTLTKHKVEMRVCKQSYKLLSAAHQSSVALAQNKDWGCEYLSAIISIKLVPSLEAAITHINRYGSAHSDAIVSNNIAHCRHFMRAVDSSSVLVNASTGFADGGEYGLGAEIGISTNKLHARGPVGVLGLTTQKYIVLGNGHCRV